MLRSGLENIVLRLKTLNMGNPKDVLVLAIDRPDLDFVEHAVVNLKEVSNVI